MKFLARLALISSLLLPAAAIAQTPQGNGQTFQPSVPAGQQIGVTSLPAPIVIGPAAAPTVHVIAGDYAADAVQWVIATFGTTIGAALTALIIKLLQNAGIDAAGKNRAKLQDMIVNGLNLAASEAEKNLQGKGQIDVKNQAVERTVQYVQAHGADTLKALGLDTTSAVAVEAIKARIETAIADPSTPTPAVLDDPAAPPKTPPIAADVTIKS